jgi:Zn-dependent protease with chaperone function
MTQPAEATGSGAPVRVERWPTEIPLLIMVVIAAAGLWVLLAISLIGFFYAFLIGAFLFVSHLSFIAHLRGSAVRLGPDQFPDLYRRVSELAARAGIDRVPEAYVMQAGGTLNALATKFLRSKMLVLYSDLLEACGDNLAARDMIIGHELGHIKAGHLRMHWFLLPGFMVPFLGMAYSRAREFTCDRYGAALCGDPRGALVGISILAAGGSHGHRVNLEALARQREQLNTGWMTIGKWLGTHPPLSERITALSPSLVQGSAASIRGPILALVILLMVFALPMIGSGLFMRSVLPEFQKALLKAQAAGQPDLDSPIDVTAAKEQVADDLALLAEVANAHRESTGHVPADEATLILAWEESHGDRAIPIDPFDGNRYGYRVEENNFILWSSGPDGQSATEDDIWLDSRDSD